MAGATYHHGDLHAEAVRRAVAMMEDAGKDTLSLRKVAAAAGVSHAALYRHFASRDALLDAVAAHGFDALTQRLSRARDRESFIAGYLDFAGEQPVLYDVSMSRSNAAYGPGSELHERLQDLLAQAYRVFGSSGDAPARRAVLRAWIILHGALGLYNAGVLRTQGRRELLRLAVDLID